MSAFDWLRINYKSGFRLSSRFALRGFVKFFITKDNLVRTDEFAAIPILLPTKSLMNTKDHSDSSHPLSFLVFFSKLYSLNQSYLYPVIIYSAIPGIVLQYYQRNCYSWNGITTLSPQSRRQPCFYQFDNFNNQSCWLKSYKNMTFLSFQQLKFNQNIRLFTKEACLGPFQTSVIEFVAEIISSVNHFRRKQMFVRVLSMLLHR